MGLWPFGRTKADVETTSRVVILRARDAVALRAKITVRFEEPQTQAIADEVAENCSEVARGIVREAPGAAAVLGFETAIAAELLVRLPKEPAAVRIIEIVGLHIVGDPGHLARPAGAPNASPAWLHSLPASTPVSSDTRAVERPTPVQGLPPARAIAGDRSLDRPTPIQPVPAVKSPPRDPFAATAVSPSPAAAPAASTPRTVVSPPQGASSTAPAAPVDPSAQTHKVKVQPPVTDPSAQTNKVKVQPPVAEAQPPAVELQTPSNEPQTLVAQVPEPALEATPSPVHVARPGNGSANVMLPPAAQPPPPKPLDPFASTAVSPLPPAERPNPVAHPAFLAQARQSSAPPPPPPARPGPARSSSSGRISAILPPDEPSASSRSFSHLGPSSTGRRSADEPSASSRSFSHLGPPSSTSSGSARASTRPPPAAVAARRRVVAARLPLPMGAGPYEVARGLTPLFRDTAGRILVAFLRTYDLTVIRRVPYDAVEGDILSSLTAPSDGAPGTYTASHAVEIHRWREAFGAPKLDQLQREANLAAAALAYEMLTAEGVPGSMTNAVVEGLAGSAFGDPDMHMDIGRYLFPTRDSASAETLANMIEVAGEDMPPGLETALNPLFASLREDVAAAAQLAREVMLNQTT